MHGIRQELRKDSFDLIFQDPHLGRPRAGAAPPPGVPRAEDARPDRRRHQNKAQQVVRFQLRVSAELYLCACSDVRQEAAAVDSPGGPQSRARARATAAVACRRALLKDALLRRERAIFREQAAFNNTAQPDRATTDCETQSRKGRIVLGIDVRPRVPWHTFNYSWVFYLTGCSITTSLREIHCTISITRISLTNCKLFQKNALQVAYYNDARRITDTVVVAFSKLPYHHIIAISTGLTG
ncbi:hypothetical protein NDU88_001718 [Pleurodeles waltl]|uniref:Uncharacterized protein n=1 Tax=Pleurodeles waltl TaxID=8319 RepID=A0AAV7M637_PLEWA|nr:hypothetical protein NDU88_001718 [Pleurodeles waltl]